MVTIAGLFRSESPARAAVKELADLGFAPQGMSMVAPTDALIEDLAVTSTAPADGHALEIRYRRVAVRCANGVTRSVHVSGPLAAALESASASSGRDSSGEAIDVRRALEGLGVNRAASEFFVDAVCAGAVMVAVRCDDGRVGEVRDVIDYYANDPGIWLQEIRAANASAGGVARVPPGNPRRPPTGRNQAR